MLDTRLPVTKKKLLRYDAGQLLFVFIIALSSYHVQFL